MSDPQYCTCKPFYRRHTNKCWQRLADALREVQRDGFKSFAEHVGPPQTSLLAARGCDRCHCPIGVYQAGCECGCHDTTL